MEDFSLQDYQMNIFPSAVRAEGGRRKCSKVSGRKLLMLGVYCSEVVKCDAGFFEPSPHN